MHSILEHLELNVSDFKKSEPFYTALLTLLGYKPFLQEKGFLEMKSASGLFALRQTSKKFINNKFHRKNTGINHVAFRVGKKEDINTIHKNFLVKKNIPTLYNTPKLFFQPIFVIMDAAILLAPYSTEK